MGLTIIVAVIAAGIGLLGLFIHNTAGAKFDRWQRRFRRWKDQDEGLRGK